MCETFKRSTFDQAMLRSRDVWNVFVVRQYSHRLLMQ